MKDSKLLTHGLCFYLSEIHFQSCLNNFPEFKDPLLLKKSRSSKELSFTGAQLSYILWYILEREDA
jgi:hypothetical protein